MRILLDTHVWLWSQEAQEQFGPEARSIILNEDNDLFVSSISSLEISRLVWRKRLTLAGHAHLDLGNTEKTSRGNYSDNA